MSKLNQSATILNGLKIAAAAVLFHTVIATTPAAVSNVATIQSEQTVGIKG